MVPIGSVVLFDRRHPPYWNFNSAFPVDIVRVKSNMNGFFNPTGVPMWVSVNKFNLVPKRIMSELFSMFCRKRLSSQYVQAACLYRVP